MKGFISNRSVKSKLMMILMAISISSVILCLLLTTLPGAYSKMAETKKELLLNARLLGSRNAAALAFNNTDLSNQSLRILEKQNNIVAGCIYDRYGKPFAVYNTVPNTEYCKNMPKDWNGLLNESVESDLQQITVVQNIFSQGEWVGGIVLFATQQAMYHYIYSQLSTGLVVILCIIAISFLFARYLQSFISKPLSDLISTAELLSHNDTAFRNMQCVPQEHELSRLMFAISSIIQRAEQTTKVLTERTVHYQKALSSSGQSLKLLVKNLQSVDDSAGAVAELIGTKSIGHNVGNYEQYIDDIKLSLSDYKCCLEAITSIAKTYEKSLEEAKIAIPVLSNVTEKIYAISKQLQSPRLDVCIDVSMQDNGIKTLYCMSPAAWDKMNDIIFSLFSVIINNNKDNMSLSAHYAESDSHGNLMLELQPNNQQKNIDLGSDTLEKLIASIKTDVPNFNEKQKEEFPDFFDEDVLSKNDFDFIIECAKYIANANDIILDINAEYPFCIIAYRLPLSLKTATTLIKTETYGFMG